MNAAVEGMVWSTTQNMVTIHCYKCGVPFGVTEEFHAEARKRTQKSTYETLTFYCPLGHGQSYVGENTEQKLQKEKEQLERQLKWAREDRDYTRRRLEVEERRAAAYKGVATKAKKRAAAALCPVDGCHRHFTQLERHLATVHPDYQADTEQWSWPAATSTIRAWARANGYEVGIKGNLPLHIRKAYEARFSIAESNSGG